MLTGWKGYDRSDGGEEEDRGRQGLQLRVSEVNSGQWMDGWLAGCDRRMTRPRVGQKNRGA